MAKRPENRQYMKRALGARNDWIDKRPKGGKSGGHRVKIECIGGIRGRRLEDKTSLQAR